MADKREGTGRDGTGGQLELRLGTPEPSAAPGPRSAPAAGERAFRVLRGEGSCRDEKLTSRDDVARVLVASAADLLLRRISSLRAEALGRKVEKVLALFDRCDEQPLLLPVLRRELDDLERLFREGRRSRA